jgi:hypothetical protein
MTGKTYYHKGNRKYEAYLFINGEKITLGSFRKQAQAKDRLKAAQEAVGEGQDIREWLASHPNKKAFSCAQEQFEEDYNSFLDEDREPTTKDGYHKKLGFAFTNFRRLQHRYEDELEGKTHVVKEVLFMDSSPDLFRDRNTVNFRYWKKHLGEIGKQITYNNLHITEFELKMALLKVFQRNIRLPRKLKPDSDTPYSTNTTGSLTNKMNLPRRSNIYLREWKKLGEELDEIVQECIYGLPERKPFKAVKIIYNPKLDLSREERQTISTEYTSQKRKDNKLQEILEYYTENISIKKLSRDSGVSRTTIKKYWNELQKQAA